MVFFVISLRCFRKGKKFPQNELGKAWKQDVFEMENPDRGKKWRSSMFSIKQISDY
jgi:hypothetical protein